MRTVGVEEELLLVDAAAGTARSVAAEVLRVAESQRRACGVVRAAESDEGGSLGPEFQNQQVEIDTPPEVDLAQVRIDLRLWRERVRVAAAETGSLVLASGTAPLPVTPERFDDTRYRWMDERYGLTASEQLSCGCHVHVGVESDEEAIGVLDRLRVWLPVLLALSANSPFWQGRDSGYQSYRAQVLTRWPTSGPTALLGSAAAYRRLVEQFIGTGVALDEGMVYFDARPSAQYPTVEVRIADVCLEIEDAVLIAALSRALVETAAREWACGVPAAPVPVSLLRLTTWHASRYGLAADLIDPREHRPRPARAVVDDLLDHVGPALRDAGDEDVVQRRLVELFAAGTGADRQRAALAAAGRLDRVVLELARISCPPPS